MENQEITEIQPNIIIGEDYDGWINLSAWKSFESRNGFYGSKDSDKKSDGIIKAHIIGESVDYVHILSQSQFNAIKFLKENSEKIRDSLLNGLLEDYPNAKDIYEDLMPEIKTISDYKDNLGVAFIHVMDSDKDNHAYIGFELGCSWDDEHGVGVMMHKDRVVKIGLADESFNHWNCYHDNGTAKYEQGKWESTQELKHQNRKNWWEFWR
ncbi:hypothetical protein HN014_04065 [Aquimarina sp. TRL1]|uniref:DUF6985 domain-containing protein n=1 Tax=Aquimarina sp. (strain TRL1) TaxID=2736252 RepID=UPI00158EE397|nr:hypothetical protein [Aquimarina sp. TRL1]QKX04115.1 hypothetical protein HN014_04065 [Aquimarina sp. TRL1]